MTNGAALLSEVGIGGGGGGSNPVDVVANSGSLTGLLYASGATDVAIERWNTHADATNSTAEGMRKRIDALASEMSSASLPTATTPAALAERTSHGF
jgi:hypothetical protein